MASAALTTEELPAKLEKMRIQSDVDPPMKEQILSSIEQVIGWTPLVEITKITKTESSLARIVAKMEGQQPAGSVKDRIGLGMILDAEKKGLITPGKTVLVEPTSGNTGLAIAMVGKQRGYKSIIVMPDACSMERRILLRALDAELVLTDAREGVEGLLKVTEDILAKTPNSHMLCQFRNQANPDTHIRSTGPEVWEGTAGKVDVFVAGVGTGGTITGTGRYLKSKNPEVKLVAVEPAESAILSGGKPGPHQIQGIGPGFVPDTLDMALLDRIVPVHSDDAIEMARRLSKEEGLLVGISSGAAFAAALRVSKEPENAGKLIVVLFPSGAERYLSTSLFEPLKEECEKMIFATSS